MPTARLMMVLLAACMLCGIGQSAEPGPAQANASNPATLIHRAYPVAALVQDTPDLDHADRAEELIELLTDLVAPRSWDRRGGPGSMEYLASDMALLVHAAAATHDQVAAAVEALHGSRDQEVTVECQVLTVSAPQAARLACQGIRCKLNHDDATDLNVTLRTRQELEPVLQALTEDRKCSFSEILSARVRNGHPGTITFAQYDWVVTDVQVVQASGSVVFAPRNEPIECSCKLRVVPVLSADRRSIWVKVSGSMKRAAQLQIPVTRQMDILHENGDLKRIPLPMYVQYPFLELHAVDKAVSVAEAQVAVLSAWRCRPSDRVDGWRTMLERLLPPVDRSLYVILLVTARTNAY